MSDNKEESNSTTNSSDSKQSGSTSHDHQPAAADPVKDNDTNSTGSSDGNFDTNDFTPIDVTPDDKEESS
uniref:Uncharacterized protein n=1 Tax=Gibberella zeae TaxID=5518 RepID=A0A4E9EJT0_GIBZA